MFVASKFILVALDSDKRNEAGELIFNTLNEAQKAIIRTHDLSIIRNPYVILGFVVIAMLVLISVTKMPKKTKQPHILAQLILLKDCIKTKNSKKVFLHKCSMWLLK